MSCRPCGITSNLIFVPLSFYILHFLDVLSFFEMRDKSLLIVLIIMP